MGKGRRETVNCKLLTVHDLQFTEVRRFMLTKKTIGFIGAGNMGEALIKGLLASKKITPAQIFVADKVKERLADIAEHYEAKGFSKNF